MEGDDQSVANDRNPQAKRSDRIRPFQDSPLVVQLKI